MKLTENQIEKLYKFTREHFVEHYDVQAELVDHLANDIENIWATQPQVSFEKARDLSFKKFGVFGFMDVITEKQKAMQKKYWKILWRFTKEWFELPKILTTAVVFLLFFSVLQSGFAYEILLASFIALMAFELFYVATFVLPQKATELLEETYPEYKIS